MTKDLDKSNKIKSHSSYDPKQLIILFKSSVATLIVLNLDLIQIAARKVFYLNLRY